ncbi:MAG: ABC transporter ATP-binding protein [Clostridiales bacterium]|nr:ABC transporter ATP-binding protein [Clostridiales bacterium]
MREEVLSVEGLSVVFRSEEGEVQAVRSVDFALKKGETLALVGESGCGKSATAKAVMGLLPPNAKVTGGRILCGGRDVLKLKERELCTLRGRKIAMVFQDPFSSLNPIVRVGKQLTEAMLIKNPERKKNGQPVLTKRQAKERALSLLREVGITDAERRFRAYPFEFSGGMRQRIVIAIALAADPEILICDEPTTALDVRVQAQILELLKGLQKERKLSVLFITHDLGVVASIADRVAVMYAGKIVEYGKSSEIFYDAKHPYTWALLSSSPSKAGEGRLPAIEGSPPVITGEWKGDAFAPRNPYALKIDFEKAPPFFQVSETHFAATWLLHPSAPKVEWEGREKWTDCSK